MSVFTLQIGSTRNIVLEETHDPALAYLHPTLARSGNGTYISIKDVPANTLITDDEYWVTAFSGGMVFKNIYDSGTTYLEHSVVQEGDDLYIVLTGETSTGELPSSSSKWFLLLESAGVPSPEDSLLYTDNTGAIQGLTITPGTPSFDGNTLAFRATSPSTYSPIRPTALGGSALNYGSSLIADDGFIYTAGYGTTNVIHNSRSTSSQTVWGIVTENIPHTGDWIRIESNYYSTYALTDTGELYVLGHSPYGALGLGSSTTLATTLTKTPLTNVIGVACTGWADTIHSAYAWTSDGKLYSCGYNAHGQLGLGNTTNTYVWTEVTGLGSGKVTKVAVPNHRYAGVLCMTDASGDNLYTWGYNGYGQLGVGNTSTKNSPQAISEHVSEILSLGGYSSHTASLIIVGGVVKSCGANPHGCLGSNNTSNRSTFLPIHNPNNYTGFTKLWGGDCYAGMVMASTDTDGKAYTWGYNGYGSLGTGNTSQKNTVQEISFPSTGKIIDAIIPTYYANGATWFLTDEGEVFHGGYSGNYQSGRGITANQYTYQAMTHGKFITAIQGGGYSSSTHINMLTDTQDLLFCGYNGHGSGGLGNTSTSSAVIKTRQL